MVRANGSKVPSIDGENSRDRAALSDRDNAGVRAAQRKVGVLLDQLCHAFEVVCVVEAGDQRTGVDEDLIQLDGPSRCGRRP